MRVPSIKSIHNGYKYCCKMANTSLATAASFGLLSTYCFVEKNNLTGSACAAVTTMALAKATRYISTAQSLKKLARKLSARA